MTWYDGIIPVLLLVIYGLFDKFVLPKIVGAIRGNGKNGTNGNGNGGNGGDSIKLTVQNSYLEKRIDRNEADILAIEGLLRELGAASAATTAIVRRLEKLLDGHGKAGGS